MSDALRTTFPPRPGPRSVTEWICEPVAAAATALINTVGGKPLRGVEVAFDLRGRVAGQARLLGTRVGLVRLNRQLFDYAEDDFGELRDTALHEMAHLCVMCSWPRARPHGKRWRSMAEALGARPTATHALPLNRARGGLEYAYELQDRTVWLGSTRHARLQTGEAQYRIRTENGSLAIAPGAYSGETRQKHD